MSAGGLSRFEGLKGVLFDKDGTLFKPERSAGDFAERMIHVLAHGDPALARRLADRGGYDLGAGRYRDGSPIASGCAGSLAADWAALLPLWEADELETWIALERDSVTRIGAPALAADLPALLDRLIGAGLSLGVATHGREVAARRQLERAGVADRFSFVAGIDSGYAPKPDPAMLYGFCAAMGIAPKDVVVIGDAVADLQMGRLGGARAAIGVLSGAAAAQSLVAAGDLVLPSIEDAPDALGVSRASRRSSAAASPRRAEQAVKKGV